MRRITIIWHEMGTMRFTKCLSHPEYLSMTDWLHQPQFSAVASIVGALTAYETHQEQPDCWPPSSPSTFPLALNLSQLSKLHLSRLLLQLLHRPVLVVVLYALVVIRMATLLGHVLSSIQSLGLLARCGRFPTRSWQLGGHATEATPFSSLVTSEDRGYVSGYCRS